MSAAPTLTKPKARRRLRKIDAALRRRIEAAIDRMIETLDALDAPAEDLEDDDPGGGDVDDGEELDGADREGDEADQEGAVDDEPCDDDERDAQGHPEDEPLFPPGESSADAAEEARRMLRAIRRRKKALA